MNLWFEFLEDFMKYLLIDDSPVFRMVIRRELDSNEHDIFVEAESGEKALEILKNESFDIITLDVEMAKMDGYLTCKAIREYESQRYLNFKESSKLKRTPIIFLTSTDTIQGRTKGYDVGATDFIPKSFQKGELKLAIQKILFPDKRLGGVKALVVDNVDSAREMMSHFLSHYGVEVTSMSDGKEAFQFLEQHAHQLDLLITEHLLPGLTGKELCYKARTELGLKTMPIIFVTSESDRSKMLEFFQAGATDYLVKPYFKEELLARLHVHLEIKLLYTNLEKNINELQKLDRLKDQFLAACSHDLRGPLNGILGFAALLLEDENLSNMQKDALLTIQSSGQYLLALINDLLDISQIQMQKETLKLKPLQIEDLVHKSISNYKSMAQSKNIEIKYHETSSRSIQGDAYALSRIIDNLLSNAIKFTEPRGVININSTYLEDGTLKLTISDSGIGIPKEKIPQLFQKFSDASRKGTQGEKSTGLGLSIVKELIKKHRGEIEVQSEIGKGTTFYLTFPPINSQSFAA